MNCLRKPPNRCSIIAAVSNNYVIGKDNRIPWHISKDFKFFKEKTLDSTVVMGRKTYESIGKPLPKRRNIVLSRNTINNTSVTTYSNKRDLFIEENYSKYGGNIFLIGGSKIYLDFFNYCDTLYITRVLAEFEGDSFFPFSFPFLDALFKKKESEIFKENGLNFKFIKYTRK